MNLLNPRYFLIRLPKTNDFLIGFMAPSASGGGVNYINIFFSAWFDFESRSDIFFPVYIGGFQIYIFFDFFYLLGISWNPNLTWAFFFQVGDNNQAPSNWAWSQFLEPENRQATWRLSTWQFFAKGWPFLGMVSMEVEVAKSPPKWGRKRKILETSPFSTEPWNRGRKGRWPFQWWKRDLQRLGTNPKL